MKGPLAILLLLAGGLAGCADAGEADPVEGTEFDDLDVRVSATTAAVVGIVVDERIVPVVGAQVALTGAGVERAMATDGQGRFAFADLAAGTYFLGASSPAHTPAQTSVEAVAGAEPAPVKLLLTRLFQQDPFVEQRKFDGFIQCNQAGIYYGSAPCITDFTGAAGGTLNGTAGCTQAGCAPQLRRVLTEQRGFRTAVDGGWQSIVLEMTWQESSETFRRMGITFSYNETQRPASHWYARSDSESPLRMEIKAGEPDDTSQGEPDMIPPEGHADLYYFVGVRQDMFPVPAVALNQNFQVFQTTFYYAIPPEGWSIVNGDPLPF